jgi:hypothetical protein
VAWAQSYAIGVDYTPNATRAGNAVFNRHRAPTSRLTRLLAQIPNIRAAAFWQSGTEIGVEGACIIVTSTTAETSMAALSWNGLNGITATARGLLLNSNRGVGFVVQTTHAKEFALAHWLVGGADGGRVCLRCFDAAGLVRENIAGDALASGTTLQWAPTSKTWQAGAVMQESDLNRRQAVRFGPEVAFAQIGIIGFDGQIELEALRLYGLPEDAPAILSGCPALPAGGRTLMLSASWDLPSMPRAIASRLFRLHAKRILRTPQARRRNPGALGFSRKRGCEHWAAREHVQQKPLRLAQGRAVTFPRLKPFKLRQ